MRFFTFLLTLALSFSMSAVARDDILDYSPVTYADLSKLAWKYKLHDYNNDKAIDNYLSIENCDLYSQYFTDDFEWQMIREGVKRDIKYFSGNYDDRFEIKAVIPIDRYDFAKSAIIISSEYSLDNAGSIQIPIIRTSNECFIKNRKNALAHFPLNVKFAADNNFSLKEIPVSADRAQDILKNISRYQYDGIDGRRAVSLRFRVKISGIKSYNPNGQVPEIIYKGQLDEIAFFEDPDMTKPIWVKSFKTLD